MGDRQRRPRGILYVARTTSGGSLESLCLLAENLDRGRFEPKILFLQKPRPATLKRLEAAGIETLIRAGPEAVAGEPGAIEDPPGPSLRTRVGGLLGARVRRAFRSLRFLRRFLLVDVPKARRIARSLTGVEFDLVHVNSDLQTGKVGVALAWMRGVPCVCHVRMWHTWTPLEHFLSRWVGRFIYISAAVEKFQLEQGVRPERGVVVHNAVDFVALARHGSAGVREQLGWTPAHFAVGMIGRLDWWKGHQHFLAALAEVLVKHREVRGLIVGAADDAKRNREYAAALARSQNDLNLQAQVVFLGHRDDVPAIIAELDALVLASTEPEPFGRVVIEGMAEGKPVIATDAGGVPEIIDDGRTGVLVPPGDAAALAAAIAGLVENRPRAAAIGAAGRRAALERFAVDRQIARVEEIYCELLDGKTLGFPGNVSASDGAEST